ncbi:MAG: UDP-glucose 4-epimerase GalE [Clostridiales bacterium]|jgi:UDP-glucose 4-epimerase|nr:UDP-glucose 4-epimerase GalE [Clostridiales bacterium]
MMKALITGGTGYVGSSISSAFIDRGHTPVILDSLDTGRDEFTLDKIFFKGDVGDTQLIKRILQEHPDIEIIVHCAESAAVSQGLERPFEYYINNVVKTLNMLGAICETGRGKIIFCSSASIYGDAPGYMATESSPVNPRSPFSRSKYIIEMILKDFCGAYDMRCISLRCFNPIGADPHMRSGMQPKNPINILGRLIRVMEGKEKSFSIFGVNWGTRDGTCIRDYTHVWDVAQAYVKAAENFDRAFTKARLKDVGFLPLNIGSGIGVTVKEFVYAFENIVGETIPVLTSKERRPGDIAGSYANVSAAKELIDWDAKMPMEEAILDAIKWEEMNKGFL